MKNQQSNIVVIDINAVKSRMLQVRGQQVLLDRDVAELYGVETKRVNEAVRNNPDKFPLDYIFPLAAEELEILRSKFSSANLSPKSRAVPKAFTEKGLYMLATVLKSQRAVEATFAIIETYAEVRAMKRELLALHTEKDAQKRNSMMRHFGEVLTDIVMPDLATAETESSKFLTLSRLEEFWYHSQVGKAGKSMDISKFDKAAECFPDLCFKAPPDVGVLLGSGWGDALQMDEVLFRIRYADIPGLGASTVKGHSGEFVLYRRCGKLIAAWCGRRHYYEGAGWEPVVLPVEILRRMGCQTLLLTNASGGINPALRPGDFVIVRDHINLVGANPLIGPHVEEWGERFPDMTEVYAKRLAELLHASANRLGLRAMDGVYAYTSGPCYETPAEIHAYKAQGADVVGMSTVPEAVFARSCGMRIAGLSLVSNLAAGISRQTLNHEEVMSAGAEAKPKMSAFIEDFIARL